MPERSTDETAHQRLSRAEETLDAHVVPVERGRVRIHRRVRTHDVEAEIELRHNDMDVQRIPVDEFVETRLEPWYDDDTLVIPVYEEVLVTETRLLLREEVRLQRRTRVENVTVEGQVREEIVDLEGVVNEQPTDRD